MVVFKALVKEPFYFFTTQTNASVVFMIEVLKIKVGRKRKRQQNFVCMDQYAHELAHITNGWH